MADLGDEDRNVSETMVKKNECRTHLENEMFRIQGVHGGKIQQERDLNEQTADVQLKLSEANQT